jgi:hypothetical protein
MMDRSMGVKRRGPILIKGHEKSADQNRGLGRLFKRFSQVFPVIISSFQDITAATKCEPGAMPNMDVAEQVRNSNLELESLARE